MVERPEVVIHIGQVYATREPTVIKTVLGSCIAACLFDPVARIGGMNHFMLPAPEVPTAHDPDVSRFGVHAMDLLIGALQRAGGERGRLQAKVFGGGHVLRIAVNGNSVPERNIRFIEKFLQTERITVASRDLGGYLPRRIQFQTDTGRVLVKRLGQQTVRQTRAEEKEHLQEIGQVSRRFGPTTLFEDEEPTTMRTPRVDAPRTDLPFRARTHSAIGGFRSTD
jgi:chemotaxis receptor (MCP) glutamine deamidase CheD